VLVLSIQWGGSPGGWRCGVFGPQRAPSYSLARYSGREQAERKKRTHVKDRSLPVIYVCTDAHLRSRFILVYDRNGAVNFLRKSNGISLLRKFCPIILDGLHIRTHCLFILMESNFL